MIAMNSITEFTRLKKLAVIGVSADPKKFGNTIYRELKSKGYTLYPVNDKMEDYNGEVCYKSILSLPEAVEGVIVCVHPGHAEKVVVEATGAGIRHIWLQQGAESEAAINLCREKGINVIHNHCILMFAEPVQSFHRFHRWLWKVFGKIPG